MNENEPSEAVVHELICTVAGNGKLIMDANGRRAQLSEPHSHLNCFPVENRSAKLLARFDNGEMTTLTDELVIRAAVIAQTRFARLLIEMIIPSVIQHSAQVELTKPQIRDRECEGSH